MVERQTDRLGFEQQARSPLDEARYRFVTTVWANKVHMIRTVGTSKKVLERQNDIAKRRVLDLESVESVSETYGKSPGWVEAQLDQALKRLLNNSPEELRIKYPQETLFKTSKEKARETLSKQKGETVASQLDDPNLSKEELKKLVPSVNRQFYDKNRRLFYRLESLLSEADRDLPASGDLSAIAGKLKQDGGVVLFSFSTKAEVKDAKVHFLTLKHDREYVLYDLRNPNAQNTQKDFRPHPSGLIMYQSF